MKPAIYFLCFLLLSIVFNPSNSFAEQGYVIGDEDVLQISVWGYPELTVQVPVRPDGMISVPMVGDIKASGMEPLGLKTSLEKEYANFVKKPTVSVIVKEINSFKVYISGEGIKGFATGGTTSAAETSALAGRASASGVMTLRRKTTLRQLLAQLGSFKGADLNNAYLFRDGKRLKNDFYKLVEKGDITQDIQLQPDDLIYIPDNFDERIKVFGAVKTPVIIPYREGLTAIDAILNAGGFTEYAKQNDVIIVRKEGGEMKNIEARLKDVVNNGDASKDVLLKPGDLVIVKTGIF
ncbi:MAG: polysaccharide biosynthesis/export family protein [Thermodesulfovibrionales bacterium]|jgi:polysaccharide export outer membrane protein